MPEHQRPLKVFLCHASQDKPAVRDLYRRLVRDGMDVWLDETSLMPGMEWQMEIPKAVREADAIIICLSNRSVTKEGYVQKEIRFALDIADEKPEGTIYLLPVRLEECNIPSRLARWQWVDLFSSDGYRKLRLSLRLRADALGAGVRSTSRAVRANSQPVANGPGLSQPSRAAKYYVDFGLVGRVFTFLAVAGLACFGLFYAVNRIVDWANQIPLPSPAPSPTATTEMATTVQTIVPELTSTGAAPTATFFVPVLLDTDVPPQISSPVSTLTLSPTSVPVPPMVIVPAGSFLMGSNNGNPDEKPARMIHVDTFYIDKYEVTNLMYSYCVGSGTCQRPVIEEGGAPRNYYGPEYSSYPVIYVSWEMARTYCEWRGARLPTEAEWEKAARGGLSGMLYPWGNEPPNCHAGARNGARYSGCSEKGTVKVASFSPNDYQIYDMAGNLWEWVSDWYRSDYYSQAAANSPNPQGPASGEDRVLRGGSWSDTNIQVALRGFAPPVTQDNEIGFRCAKAAAP